MSYQVETRLELTKKYAASLNVTVTATGGKTYTAQIVDRYQRTIGTGSTVTIVDPTTVTISMTATETENIQNGQALALNATKAFYGYWYLTETGGASGNVLAASGPVDWLRPPEA